MLRLSEVSLREYVEIVVHYNRQCSKPRVSPAINNSRYTEEQLKLFNEKLGTEKVNSLNLIVENPKRFVCPYFNYYFELYHAYKKGILPYPGSMSNQPNKIIEVFGIFSALELEQQERINAEYERSKK